MRRAVLIFGLMFCLPASLMQAGECIWVALVKCDGRPANEESLQKWECRLKPVFGYEGYHLVYETRVPCGEKYAQWALPRKDFYLKVEPFCQASNGNTGVLFEVYRGKAMLISGRFHPTGSRPLFINGPDYQDGKLIFLMQIVPDPAPAPEPK
jgi:hypothetical protein